MKKQSKETPLVRLFLSAVMAGISLGCGSPTDLPLPTGELPPDEAAADAASPETAPSDASRDIDAARPEAAAEAGPDAPPPTCGPGSGHAPTTYQVKVAAGGFDPPGQGACLGDTIEWVFEIPGSVTSGTLTLAGTCVPNGLFYSGSKKAGETYRYKPTFPAMLPYFKPRLADDACDMGLIAVLADGQ